MSEFFRRFLLAWITLCFWGSFQTAWGSPLDQRVNDLPEGVTSFGAAATDDWIYVYGGHLGDAHHYHDESQANQLWRTPRQKPGTWTVVGKGPRLQGLAMVAYRGDVIRIGGFQAKNPEGKDHDLWSVAEVARFRTATKSWEELPALPEPRSSHDAVLMGDTVYVVGGWKLAGEETTWHTTAWKLDLSAEKPRWEALPAPPFQRRALSLAQFQNKLYVIGGMNSQGGPTRAVAILDPTQGSWSSGPELIGEESMEGFGNSAFYHQGKLWVSTYSGKLQRLSDDGKQWLVDRQLKDARFFHRMIPLDAAHLVSLGGANMESGKFLHAEVISTGKK